MVKTKNLSLATRYEIIALHKIHLSNREIAKRLHISHQTVDYNVKKFNENGSVKYRVRQYSRKTTTKEDDFIVNISLRDRKLCVPDITAEVNKTFKNPISESTVRRRLKEKGIYGRVAVKKPLLRPANVKKRFQWAKEHKKWTIDQWRKVLWSDESKFEIFGSKRKIYVRRRKNEKYARDCIVPSVKHGGGSVMVWGCFAGSQVGDLMKVDGILNKEGYKKILQNKAVPSGKRLIGSSFIFQQDNDPKHTSKLCKEYLASLEKKKTLKVMKWPPQSPDLNPIELLWEELDRAVRKTRSTSASNLWNILKEEWTKIKSTTLDKLVERMPRLCQAVIKSKGHHFDEKKV